MPTMKNIFSLLASLLLAVTAHAQTFTEITTSIIPYNLPMTKVFGSNTIASNANGCMGVFNTHHGDGGESALYIQEVTAEGVCSGVLTYVPRTLSNHSQPLPASMSIAFRTFWCNCWGDSDGMWGYWGDGPGNPKYIPESSSSPGGVPVFQSKTQTTAVLALPTVWSTPGQLDFVHFGIASTYVSDPFSTPASKVIITPAQVKSRMSMPLDVDAFGVDSAPEIINLAAGGYWRNDGTWCACLPVLTNDTSPQQWTPTDYDLDGDQDLYFNQVVGALITPMVLTNNFGIFSQTALPTIATNGYWANYGNALQADFDLDGYSEILICAPGFSTARIVRNAAGVFGTYQAVTIGFPQGGSKPFCGAGDIDNDGDIDISSTGAAPRNTRIYGNNLASGNHYIRFHLRGLGTNSDGIGASILVRDHTTQVIVATAQITAYQPHLLIPHLGVGASELVDVSFIFPHEPLPTLIEGVEVDATYIIYEQDHSLVPYTPGNIISRQPI
jgi:hypothetical protein